MTSFTSVTPAENYQTIRPLGHGGMGEVFEAVATKRPNAWGFYDMLSNGREFVADTLAMTNWTGKYPDDSLDGKGMLGQSVADRATRRPSS